MEKPPDRKARKRRWSFDRVGSLRAIPEQIDSIFDDVFAAKKTKQIPSGLTQSATTYLRHIKTYLRHINKLEHDT